MRYKNCCPVCRAICCVFNDKDTCGKYIPSDAPGYDCPEFFARSEPGDRRACTSGHSARTDNRTDAKGTLFDCAKDMDDTDDLLKAIFRSSETDEPDEDDIPIVFVELAGGRKPKVFAGR